VAKPQTVTFALRSRAAVARRAHNPKVRGSIPLFATNDEGSNEPFLFLAMLTALMNLITFSILQHQAWLSNSVILLF
jgi:hypothetical protein